MIKEKKKYILHQVIPAAMAMILATLYLVGVLDGTLNSRYIYAFYWYGLGLYALHPVSVKPWRDRTKTEMVVTASIMIVLISVLVGPFIVAW